MLRRFVCFVVLLALSSVAIGSPNSDVILGFTAAGSAQQRELEQKFDSYLRADNLREWMKRFSSRPHHIGSLHNRENAEFIASLFRSWGYDTQIEQFDVLFPTPKTRVVEMTSPEKFTLKLNEPAVKEDADLRTAGRTAADLQRVFDRRRRDGSAGLCELRQCRPIMRSSRRRGIDVKGKIVISRYGGSWRGIKPKVAAEHGAVGCIIYSDPRNDGFYQGDVYPKGAWRNENGVQRGSVMDMPLYPGDPLTKASARPKTQNGSTVRTRRR